MRRWRNWLGLLCVVVLGWSLPATAGEVAWRQTQAGRMAFAGAHGSAPEPTRIWQVSVPVTADLPGTFSGLYRDPGDGLYWTITDSGPGTADWPLRLVRLRVTPQQAEVVSTLPITEDGRELTGLDLDPEDVAVAPDGTLWIVDEYRPWLVHLGRDGRVLQRIETPARYRDRTKGQGLEGVAVSPDGRTVYAILQSGLSTVQDKTQTWLLAFDVATGAFQEFPYQLDDPARESYPAGVTGKVGANGLAVVGHDTLLVIERDNQSGANARVKRIYQVQVPSQPAAEPLPKTLVVDLVAHGYTLEKLEGIAVPQPRTLALINDNDGDPDNPVVLWMVRF